LEQAGPWSRLDLGADWTLEQTGPWNRLDPGAGRTLEQGAKIKIFTDSLSSIESLKGFNIRTNFVLNIKKNPLIMREGKSVYLGSKPMLASLALNCLTTLQKMLHLLRKNLLSLHRTL
ncbi:hypothetical protein AVEN_203186-1, partial [Araneus ventricosus]